MIDENVSHAKKHFVGLFVKQTKPIPSEAYDIYWHFAAERQHIFFDRFENKKYPWTTNAVLRQYKFTNVYRASDRVSQYLIRNVIYTGDTEPANVFFRIILFKIFNRISTWESLTTAFGEIAWNTYSFEQYDKVLSDLLSRGIPIYSGAYIMASGKREFGHMRKHRNHLALLEWMMKDRLHEKLEAANSLAQVYHLFRAYPTVGEFLAYQYTIDVNYSTITNFSEMDFVKAGPGARRGVEKCFASFGNYTYEDIIKMMTYQQEDEFARLGIDFQTLWGRPLQLIDCQNIFCEVDKYTRVAHPELNCKLERKRIKQQFSIQGKPSINYFFPPKWNINPIIENRKCL